MQMWLTTLCMCHTAFQSLNGCKQECWQQLIQNCWNKNHWFLLPFFGKLISNTNFDQMDRSRIWSKIEDVVNVFNYKLIIFGKEPNNISAQLVKLITSDKVFLKFHWIFMWTLTDVLNNNSFFFMFSHMVNTMLIPYVF